MSTADREIVLTRVFDAPRELVWQAWTDPQHVARWWGPRGFTTTTHAMDVRPGGTWRHVMHGPDGRDYPNNITYLEVVRPERLVYQHGGHKGAEPARFTTTATFEDRGGGKTEVTLRMVFPSAEAKDFTVRTYGAIEGGKQTLERLGEHVATMQGGSPPFVITRVFDAPRSLVWQAWTERDRLMQWFGPRGFTMRAATLDFRPGGTFHYCLRGPDGSDMWGKFVYRAVEPPERLVWVNSFSDEHGNITHHPMMPTWPREMLTTTTFTELAGRTTVTVRWEPISPTPAERATFDAGHDSMRGGWTGTFEQLTAYLAKA